jgi:putative OPT family oligopeptide transporter
LALPLVLQQSVNGISIVLVLGLGFCLAAVCAYFAGLVGSSASPLSSMSLVSLIIGSFILSILLGQHIHLTGDSVQAVLAAGIALIITSTIACMASISLDTIQDLKAGQMVGATPWKQQVMLILGVVVAALVIPFTLQLLFEAYGLGGVMPRPNMDPTQMLAAPQAGLMAAIVQGIFTHHVQWDMMTTGVIIAFIILIVDQFLRRFGLRLPVLAVGIGIYLPIDTTTPLIAGGILSWVVERGLQKRYKTQPDTLAYAHQKGLLLASGLVAGSAVMGVVLAIPFVLAGSSNVLRLIPAHYELWTGIASVVVTLALCIWIKCCICSAKE